jgi:hypothetical protein
MMYFGTNQNHYADVEPQVHGMTMLRSYKGLSDTWPVMDDGLLALLSIRPDPATLLEGGYDAPITGMLRTAPPGSLFTAWHEMDKNVYDPSAFPASVGRGIHAHMLALTHKVNPAVKYGSVLTEVISAK